MNIQKYEKNIVVEQLRKNREQHHTIFLEAVDGYQTEAIKIFKKNIDAIKSGDLVQAVYLDLPVDHTKEYDHIIAMLENSKGDEVELTQGEFVNYFLDDWAWKEQFLTSNSYYSMSAAQALK